MGAIATGYYQLMGIDLLYQILYLKIGDYLFTGLVTIHTLIGLGADLINAGVIGEYVY